MCTTMIITRGATADGSTMVTHSDDDELADQRFIHVPAQHPAWVAQRVPDGTVLTALRGCRAAPHIADYFFSVHQAVLFS
ncbi:C69 family dipeptidase [Dickeya solani]|uniref:Dipeptidase n=2 Tax=Dickeya solani TaxID=1089444 RepID=A0ABU4EFV2_9GAMM|nr:C69 family dipeptidase [Dickeya solani]MDV7042902.1 C69 family dipeptidase [Dickeya solani]